MLLFSGLIIAATATVIANGINKGIERVSGVLTPLRFVILFLLLIYSAIFADFGAAARFLFSIDWSKLTTGVVVTAFGQAFFSLGVGVGVLMMMGAYMKREYSITRGVLTVAVAQGLVALVAGMSIFPLVFTYGLEPTQGPGLIFVTLPVAFAQMPYGEVFGTLLFLLLSFAALTATIVIQEPIVAALEEYTRWSRPVLAYGTGLIIWLLGFVTVFSFNRWSDVHPLEWIGVESTRTPFELLDHLTSNIMMPLGGLMVALIAGWSLSRRAVCEELGLGDGLAFKLWYGATRYLVPLAILVIFYSVI
jgi:NSS family neurotransmitter:Na+ symporter